RIRPLSSVIGIDFGLVPLREPGTRPPSCQHGSTEKLYPPRLRARSVRRGPSRWSPVPFPRTPIDEHRAWGDRRLRHHGSDPLPHAGEGALPSVRALRGERRHVPKEGRPPRPPRTGGRHIRPRGHRRPRVWCGGARQLDAGLELTDIAFAKRGSAFFRLGHDRRGLVYVLHGTGSVDDHELELGHGALLENMSAISIQGEAGYRIALASVPRSGPESSSGGA